jgi:hypothetical protein
MCRYQEDISWIDHVFDLSNVIIINKGINDLDSKYNIINEKNVGRHQHAFYKYIVDNFNNLPKQLIFIQAFPFDHFMDVLHNISFVVDNHFLVDHYILSDFTLSCQLFGCVYKPDMNLKKTYKKIFQQERNIFEPFIFGIGGQFIVSSRRIQKKPIEFYERIVNLLNHHSDPIDGYCVEAFNNLIFNDEN